MADCCLAATLHVLHCTGPLQEIVGSDDSALQAVVAADVELMELRQEEAEILGRQDAAEGTGATNGTAEAPAADDEGSDRLNEIYERMQVQYLTSRTYTKSFLCGDERCPSEAYILLHQLLSRIGMGLGSFSVRLHSTDSSRMRRSVSSEINKAA